MTTSEKVLLVDDEINLLKGLHRQLRGRFTILTAVGGEDALKMIEQEGPLSVIVCDMRMPGMTGVEVLEKFSKKSPLTTRIMLTGNADQDCAVESINKGHIFRFLNKPCETETLAEGIEAGLEHYRAITAEKKLLETTLAGSIKLLSDVVSLMDPTAAGNAGKVADWANRLAPHIRGVTSWELNFAAMLAPLGRVSIPAELLVRNSGGEPLSKEEKRIFRTAPEVGSTLIGNVPRMGSIAKAILYQDKHFDGKGFPDDDVSGANIPLIARILHVLKAIALLTDGHEPGQSVFERLKTKEERFDPTILELARKHLTVKAGDGSSTERSEEVTLYMLKPGQELIGDIKYEGGGLVLARGTILSAPQIARLRSLAKVQKIKEPIHVIETA